MPEQASARRAVKAAAVSPAAAVSGQVAVKRPPSEMLLLKMPPLKNSVSGMPLPVAGSGVAATRFAEAPIPRLDAVPPMRVVLVDEGEAPGGAGETVIVAAAAAIANAVRAATGRRPTRFPLAAADFAQT